MSESRYPNRTERHGPAVLMGAGLLMILSAVAAVFTGHEVVGGGLAVPGVLAVLVGAVLDRMEGPFNFLGMSGNLRPLDPPTGEVRAVQQLASGQPEAAGEAVPMVPDSIRGGIAAGHSNLMGRND